VYRRCPAFHPEGGTFFVPVLDLPALPVLLTHPVPSVFFPSYSSCLFARLTFLLHYSLFPCPTFSLASFLCIFTSFICSLSFFCFLYLFHLLLFVFFILRFLFLAASCCTFCLMSEVVLLVF